MKNPRLTVRQRRREIRTPSSAGTETLSSVSYTHESMADFAWVLSLAARIGDRQVVDKTGLEGNYDFTLTFDRNPVPPAGTNAPPDLGPYIFGDYVLDKAWHSPHNRNMAGRTHRIGPNLIETARVFASEETCHEYLSVARWPDGVRCLKCDHEKVFKFTLKGKIRTYANGETKPTPDRYLYQCLKCRYQFAATTGTIFSDTHLPLSKWMLAVALMCNAEKGLSAKQMERDMDVSYKTAWYLNHRIREAMAEDGSDSLTGIIEVDETSVGGKAKNMHAKRRKERIGGRGVRGKDTVFGMVERDRKVKTFHVPALNRYHVIDKLKEGISVDATLVCSDESQLYKRMPSNIQRHEIVNHSEKEYVRGEVRHD